MYRYLPGDEIPRFLRRLERVKAMTRIQLVPDWAHVLDMTVRR